MSLSLCFFIIFLYLTMCHIIVLHADSWTKHIWDTMLVMYKAALTQWHKDTGGGTGLETEFENWDQDKYGKYGVDPCSYDHTDVAKRLICF